MYGPLHEKIIGSLYEGLLAWNIYFIILFYAVWGLNIFICLFSALSKNQEKDPFIHILLPIVILLFTNYTILGYVDTVTGGYGLLNLFMFLIIIAAFIKRSRFCVSNTVIKNDK